MKRNLIRSRVISPSLLPEYQTEICNTSLKTEFIIQHLSHDK